ncbi:MAG: fumarate hydratase [Candidatus Omnitrophica bacterium]|nr:fumarate hydratase [Candidatus Omnitrophota bacterium]
MDIKKQIEQLVARANFNLRADVLHLLQKAYRLEKNIKAKNALGWILENAKIAKKESLAICQDTGLPVVFIAAGKDVSVSSTLVKAIEEAVASGYAKNYLRASVVDPLKRGTPSYIGVVSHVEFPSSFKGLKITILPKGFGSENKSQLRMFNPTAGLGEIEDFIVEAVKRAGPEACPPYIIGIGIGGTSDTALLLAKKALLQNLDKPNQDKTLRQLEQRLCTKINSLHIGPMGLGGKCTVLAVKIKTAPTHIAGLPVGVNISCHALRSATIKIARKLISF